MGHIPISPVGDEVTISCVKSKYSLDPFFQAECKIFASHKGSFRMHFKTSVAGLIQEPEVQGSIPGPAT